MLPEEGCAGGLSTQPQRGQTLVEYALILVFIAVVLIVSLVAFRESVSAAFSTIVAVWPVS
ncbi:MAG: Flp family type IVb pilin [Chloroflexi bacterium]|nr:Flp family type IVb pilin [Chloroflexota bacterium]